MTTVATEQAPILCAVYCRISSDPTGQALGVARQQEDCLRLAESKGWAVAATFIDNDFSAFSGKPRPRYEAMLNFIRDGGCQAIIAWAPDRLHRSPVELEHFIALVDAHGVAIDTVQAGSWDLTTPAARMVARQLGSVARYESEHKAERIRRAMQQRRDQGKALGRIGYGWKRRGGRDVIEPEQAAVVAEISRRIIAGDSLRGIARDLTERRVPTPRDVEIIRKTAAAGKVSLHKPECVWTAAALSTLATRPRNAGLRTAGTPVPGGRARVEVVGAASNVDPIISEDLHQQVQAVLRDPSRKTSGGTAARHLLSGIARCGVCDAPLRVAMRSGATGKPSNRAPRYRCHGKELAPGSGSQHVSRRADSLEAFIVVLVLARLSHADARGLLAAERGPQVQAAAEQAAALRARLDVAADQYADGVIDARQFERVSSRVRPQLELAEARARVVDDTALFAGVVDAVDVRAAWDGLSLSRQRAVVDALMQVRVHRTAARGNTFEPDSVEIIWRR